MVLLTKNLAIDYGRSGIRANAICPGFIETPMLRERAREAGMEAVRDDIRPSTSSVGSGGPGRSPSVARFLSSRDASFVTGVALPVDGGYTAGHRHGVSEMLGLD